ncbi:TPA: glycosyltransferase [Vibrio cholerae]|uniref:glycosyltransferase n=1 Tax=Vibrio cholerae TaxID=666 RepID=UPI0002C16AC3|nr:glycosyltransferase [Vibrio cholerae]EMQ71470.1 glycosyl transferases group 1 family protein [Vibrio cholerae O1 str. NHCC-008D]QKU56863.1 glycosyltransferase [Vibrio cholerae]
MKNLFVIAEPEILFEQGTRNNALNEILKYYTSYNLSVTYISGSSCEQSFEINGVVYKPLSNYSKNKRNIFIFHNEIRSFFLKVVNVENLHIQFRLPSIYSLQVYFLVRDIIPKDKISFYIAGDWKESLKFNYPRKKVFHSVLPFIQKLVIKGKVCVCTGEKLLSDNKAYISRGLDFYSTTHTIDDVCLVPVSRENSRSICFVGRIEKLKNYQFMLHLAKGSLGSKYSFHWLGDGPDREILEQEVAFNNLSNVHIHGHVSDRRVFDEIVTQCKYFVLCSYTEGTSKTLPEMMCRSVIPIAFKGVGSNSKILSFGNGILVDVDDYNDVTQKIIEIDNDSNKYHSLLDCGNNYAKLFTVESQLARMFEFLYS